MVSAMSARMSMFCPQRGSLRQPAGIYRRETDICSTSIPHLHENMSGAELHRRLRLFYIIATRDGTPSEPERFG